MAAVVRNHVDALCDEALGTHDLPQVPGCLVSRTAADLKEHAEMMRKMPEMSHHTIGKHLALEPGQQGALIWRFDEPGMVDFACLVPGHYEAGMIGKIVVK